MTKYSLTGPFTNGTSPGISATFLNNVETFLAYAADTNITTDGSGNLTVASVALTHGTVTRIAFGFSAITTGGTTVTHNLGANPTAIFMLASSASVTQVYASSTVTTTTFTAFTVGANGNCWWMAIV